VAFDTSDSQAASTSNGHTDGRASNESCDLLKSNRVAGFLQLVTPLVVTSGKTAGMQCESADLKGAIDVHVTAHPTTFTQFLQSKRLRDPIAATSVASRFEIMKWRGTTGLARWSHGVAQIFRRGRAEALR
jgi:hypothetical protein